VAGAEKRCPAGDRLYGAAARLHICGAYAEFSPRRMCCSSTGRFRQDQARPVAACSSSKPFAIIRTRWTHIEAAASNIGAGLSLDPASWRLNQGNRVPGASRSSTENGERDLRSRSGEDRCCARLAELTVFTVDVSETVHRLRRWRRPSERARTSLSRS